MIQKISVGQFTSFCVASNKVYAAGDNRRQQLSLPKANSIPIFTQITSLPAGKKIRQIAAGWNCTYVVLEDNTLWSAGENRSGYLGLSTDNPPDVPFTRVKSLPKEQAILKIAVKKSFCLVLLADGSVWVAGDNGSGQLGLGTDIRKCITFTKVRTLPQDKRVVDIAAGVYGSFVKLDDNSIWSTGLNICGHLGFSSENSRTFQPLAQFQTLPPCQKMVVGAVHSLFLLEDGSLMGMGDKSKGQLGIGAIPLASSDSDSDERGNEGDTPLTKLPTPDSKQIITDIFAGWYTSFIVLSDGSLWVTGDNTEWTLGTTQNQRIGTFVKITEFPKEKRVIQVSSALNHSCVLLNDGSLWFTGKNISGQFGFGDTTSWRGFIRCPFQG